MQESNVITEPKRDGKYIIALDGTTLPARCAVCNGEAFGSPIKVSVDDRRSGGLVGAAVAEAFNAVKGSYYTGPVIVRFHLCRKHREGAWQVWCALFILLIAVGVGASTSTRFEATAERRASHWPDRSGVTVFLLDDRPFDRSHSHLELQSSELRRSPRLAERLEGEEF